MKSSSLVPFFIIGLLLCGVTKRLDASLLPAQESSPENIYNSIDTLTAETPNLWLRTAPRPQSRMALGNLDPAFGADIAQGSTQVYSLAIQADGKFLVGGNFTAIDGLTRGSLERFGFEGNRDAGFNVGGTGANGAVYVIVVLASGKIMIAGSFTIYNQLSSQRVARLNADGTLDSTFSAQGSSTNAAVQDMIVLPDGKILICGSFTSFNGTVRNRVARLNGDGTLDSTFNPDANGFVEELILQPDGRIIIGGTFTTVGGTARAGISRLNANGTVDSTFNVGNGVGNGAIYAAERQTDGKILIGGLFSSYNNFARNNVARLNIDGSLDMTFNPNTDGLGAEFFAIQPDGKIVVVGLFAFSDAGIVRLNTDGTLDGSFNGRSVDDVGYTVAVQSDGKILLGGLFSIYGGVPRTSVARLNMNGFADGFAPLVTIDPVVRAIFRQSDGKILVGGQFAKANGISRRNVARFHSDGTLDTSFDPANNFGGRNSPSVWSLGVQSDGKIMVGGNFSLFYESSRNYVARLHSNGSLDTNFFYDDAVTVVRDIEAQPDGKIVLAGFFYNEFRQVQSGIVRLNNDGSYDPSVIGTGANGIVTELEPLADGRGMIAGAFTTYNGTIRNRIARINPDGSLDTTFNPGTGANSTVYDIALRPNGQMYVGGFFTSFNGLPNTNDIVRLSSSGGVDTSFTTGSSGFDGGIFAVLIEPDGKVFVGGNIKGYNGTPVNRLALLNANGTLDGTLSSFLSDDPLSTVYRFERQPDGKILVGGLFSSPRNALLRLTASRVSRSILFDYDGDGKSDISLFRPSNGDWYHLQSRDGLFGMRFGLGTDKIVPADYDGDGKADIAVYRPSDKTWYVVKSSDGTFSYHVFGLAEDVPVPGDFDGDGRADISVFRPSDSTWYRLNSRDGSFFGRQFGAGGDKPVMGDFDGDGKADLALFRPSNGVWYQIRSSDGAFFGEQFGVGDDKVVPADYDGDGKTDLAVYRASNGFWYIKRSQTAAFTQTPFGAAADIPAPGDFDGDGKANICVFRPSEGQWYRLNSSTGGFSAFPFGMNGDRPTQSAFQ